MSCFASLRCLVFRLHCEGLQMSGAGSDIHGGPLRVDLQGCGGNPVMSEYTEV